jgi:hypothetical protein
LGLRPPPVKYRSSGTRIRRTGTVSASRPTCLRPPEGAISSAVHPKHPNTTAGERGIRPPDLFPLGIRTFAPTHRNADETPKTRVVSRTPSRRSEGGHSTPFATAAPTSDRARRRRPSDRGHGLPDPSFPIRSLPEWRPSVSRGRLQPPLGRCARPAGSANPESRFRRTRSEGCNAVVPGRPRGKTRRGVGDVKRTPEPGQTVVDPPWGLG